jgi:cytochrome c-type biogenesis protein CcmE
MPILPKSRTARRRLGVVSAAAVVLALAVGLAVFALRDSQIVSLFYSPSQAAEAKVPAGRNIQLGGLVAKGSVEKFPDGSIHFVVTDNVATTRVVYHGDLPDLFREGQGVVTKGAFDEGGVFKANHINAKHDENYMPKEVADSLKASGEWKGEAEGMTRP